MKRIKIEKKIVDYRVSTAESSDIPDTAEAVNQKLGKAQSRKWLECTSAWKDQVCSEAQPIRSRHQSLIMRCTLLSMTLS